MDFADALSYLRQMNLSSTLLRLTLAVIFGGIIGIGRERKGRAAGFRTYMLVCLGSALTMMIGQYLFDMLHTRWTDALSATSVNIDVARIGAQVINGIGFLGAGTIIVTRTLEVKGVTTAAGLWTSGCTGLAIGAGFYEGVALSFFIIFLAMNLLPKLEESINSSSRYMNLYAELSSSGAVSTLIESLRENEIQVFDVEFGKTHGRSTEYLPVFISLYLPWRRSHLTVLSSLSRLDGICAIEEV